MSDTSTFSPNAPVPDPSGNSDANIGPDPDLAPDPTAGPDLPLEPNPLLGPDLSGESAATPPPRPAEPPPALDPDVTYVQFQPNWHTLRGMGFGQREPVVVGRVRVELPKTVDFDGLDAAIARYITEELPEDLNRGSRAERLINRILQWSAALQREVRIPIFGRAYVSEPIEREGGGVTMRVAVPYFAPPATSAALSWVTSAINYYLYQGRLTPAPNEEAEKRHFESVVTQIRKFLPGGINTYRFLAAAHDNQIPAHQFIPSIYSFGEGIHTRWLQSSFTDQTGHLGTQIAGNKASTAYMMHRAGLPAPRHAPARSEQEAVQIAKRLGYPVVVKPADRRQGMGVAADLRSDDAVVAAFREARKHSPNILVEKHFDGTDYRLTVFNGKLIDVFGRTPGGVIGDGGHSVAELVEAVRSTPRYAIRMRERGTDPMALDDEARQLLREAGLTPESVPAENQYVKLRRRGNLSAGGTRQPIELDEVHPDNKRVAERAVAALRLDLGGVDLIMPDISRSWMETGAIINEVNVQPQLGSALSLLVLKTLFPGDGRIPVVLVVGQSGCIDWPRLREQFPDSEAIGFASTAGVWLGGERLTAGQQNGFAAARILLDNPLTEAAVIVMGPNEIRRLGLPKDMFDVMILDSPDNWSQEGRDATGSMLELAMPHARRVVSLRPSHPLFAKSPYADRWETASGVIIQDVCAGLTQPLFANRAQAPAPEAQEKSTPDAPSG